MEEYQSPAETVRWSTNKSGFCLGRYSAQNSAFWFAIADSQLISIKQLKKKRSLSRNALVRLRVSFGRTTIRQRKRSDGHHYKSGFCLGQGKYILDMQFLNLQFATYSCLLCTIKVRTYDGQFATDQFLTVLSDCYACREARRRVTCLLLSKTGREWAGKSLEILIC